MGETGRERREEGRGGRGEGVWRETFDSRTRGKVNSPFP